MEANETAKQLILHMNLLYGKLFVTQWQNIKPTDLEENFSYLIADLSQEHIDYGYKIMTSYPYPPTLPLFRKWCLSFCEGKNADTAWLEAIKYESSNETTEISTFVLKALNTLKKSGLTFDLTKDDTAKSFKIVYDNIVFNAQARGIKDSVVTKKNNDCDSVPREVIPMPLETQIAFRQFLKKGNKIK